MTFQPPVGAYSLGGGISPISDFVNAVINTRNPTTADTDYPLGQMWVNKSANTSYVLTSLSTTSGQLSANWTTNAAAGVSTLTGDTGGAISPTAGNINIVGGGGTVSVAGSGSTLTINATVSGYPITPYVVGPSGQAGYQTIQSAIEAAHGAGGTATIFIQPGTYTEDLTLYEGINLWAYPGQEGSVGISVGTQTIPAVVVEGSLSLDTSGASNATYNTVSNIMITPATGDVVTYICNQLFDNFLSFYGCVLALSDSGHTCIVTDGFPFIIFQNCVVKEFVVSTGNLLSLPGTYKFCTLYAENTEFNINSVTPCPIQGGSGVHINLKSCAYRSLIDCSTPLTEFSLKAQLTTFDWSELANQPLVNFGSQNGSIDISDCFYLAGSGGFSSSTNMSSGASFKINNTCFTDTITLINNCRDDYAGCIFNTETAVAIAMESATNVSLSNCVINSSHNPAISGSGAGTLTLTDISFLSNTSIAGTLTLAYDTTKTGAFTQVGASSFSGGTVTVASGTSAINISADAAATTVNVATGAAVKTTTLGSTNTTSTTTVQSGSGGVAITGTNGAVTVNSGTGALGISTDASATTLSIGTGGAAKTITIGSTNTTSATNLTAGSGSVNCATDFNLTAVATKISLNGGAATDFIGRATLTNGQVTVSNTNIAAGDRILLTRSAKNASSAYGTPTTTISAGANFSIDSQKDDTTTETNDQSTYDYVIFRQN